MGTALTLHIAHVALYTVDLGHFPLDSPLEFLTVLAATLLVLYKVIEKVLKVRQTGSWSWAWCS